MDKLNEVLEALKKFRDDRNWKQFHTPENLSKSISIEAAELLENFQWGNTPADINNVKEEVADIFSYLVLFCDDLNINLFEETLKKINKNCEKYPVDKAFGSSKKYNKL